MNNTRINLQLGCTKSERISERRDKGCSWCEVTEGIYSISIFKDLVSTLHLY